MGARTNKIRHNNDTRDKIKAGVIIDRLEKHVLAKEPIMTDGQVSAARVLLNKVLPDLKAMQVTGKDDGPIGIEVSPSEKLKSYLGSVRAKSG
jgi:hypothetical protein